MKKKLKPGEYITITSMLFGLFFGAGNLIFPALMGQMAGRSIWQAVAGFLITGVGLPLLGVAALGMSRCDGLAELSGRVGRRYSLFFTCALYLTIGPFFAIPRCATVSFTVGIEPIVGQSPLALPLFSAAFFAAVLFFSLKPSGILTWVGRVLNPVFLLSLGILVVRALLSPMGVIQEAAPAESYSQAAFFTGFVEGYNTMDALAGLAFGIVVVTVIKQLGVTEPEDVAASTVKAGVFSCLLMGVIYVAVSVVGAQSRGAYPICGNGGQVLALVAEHYFGRAGALILAVTVTFACLKTAVGLITSCGETFAKLFPRAMSYSAWVIVFSGVSMLIANLGLSAIISYSLPVLMFLYPLAITLILLSLCSKLFGGDRAVYVSVSAFTAAAALPDFFKALPEAVRGLLSLDPVVSAAGRFLPLFELGLGWLLPAAVGLAVGLVIHRRRT